MPNEQLMTNFVNAHALGLCWMGIILFHISIMHARLKRKKKSYVYAQAHQVSHMIFFWGSYPARRVFLKVDTRPTLVDT